MKITVYDHSFNANEWFVVVSLVIGYLLMIILPKKFTIKQRVCYVLYGVFTGKFFDHTISIKPFDYYDVNDKSTFQVIDFASYIMFGPFGYFYVYIFEKLNIRKWKIIPYVFFWSIIAIGVEYVASKLGVYHYKNGYHILYGFPIYLLTQSGLLWIHYLVKVKGQNVPLQEKF